MIVLAALNAAMTSGMHISTYVGLNPASIGEYVILTCLTGLILDGVYPAALPALIRAVTAPADSEAKDPEPPGKTLLEPQNAGQE